MLFIMSVPTPAERSGPDNQTLDECIRRMAGGDREGLATPLRADPRRGIWLYPLHSEERGRRAGYHPGHLRAAVPGRRAIPLPAKPMAWILTIARNLALNHYKERQRTTPPVAELDLTGLDHQDQVTSEDKLVLESLLSQLGGGTADCHPPCPDRPEAPGDRPAAPTPFVHSSFQVPSRDEETPSRVEGGPMR